VSFPEVDREIAPRAQSIDAGLGRERRLFEWIPGGAESALREWQLTPSAWSQTKCLGFARSASVIGADGTLAA
jgi:hypothetical protein